MIRMLSMCVLELSGNLPRSKKEKIATVSVSSPFCGFRDLII
jgi:hypothetical protein